MQDRLPQAPIYAALMAAVCLFVSSPASAGFQWVAPSEMAPAPSAVSGASQSFSASAPVGQVTSSPEIISPVVITGGGSQPVPVAASSDAAQQASSDDLVRGFAKSVPLAVALRQILPAGYAFSIDQDVDMGTLVSFRGGRPWRDTLRDSLEPVGLIAHEQGQVVSIRYPAHGLTSTVATSANRDVAVPVTPAPVIKSSFQPGMEPRPLVSVDVSAPAAPAPQVAADAGLPESWTAERGESLRKVLDGWSRRSRVEFDWLSEYDYPLEASVAFTGTFENAVRNLLSGFEGAHPQPVAELHSNANLGQLVLVVQTRGNTNSD